VQELEQIVIRKQIYLRRRQNLVLKRLAKQRGISEAEVIRQALEREATFAVAAITDGQEALKRLIAHARSLRERPETSQGTPHRFNREELYEDREERWTRPK
jgi:hypothetical protein